jgi:hypothetical protein
MYEWEVKLTKGAARVYGERYTVSDGFYRFWSGQVVLKSFPAAVVVSVTRTWPEA